MDDIEQDCFDNIDNMVNCVLKIDVNNCYETVLNDFPEVLDFIRKLQNCIIKQRTIINKIYHKNITENSTNENEVLNSKTVLTCDASTQTDDDHDLNNKVESTFSNFNLESGNSILEQVKEVAESAVRQSGFAYEASSGLYYDYNTGYYYNAELGLYYDGSSGNYLKYDEATKTYEYHSSICDNNSIEKQACILSVDRRNKGDANEDGINDSLQIFVKKDKNVDVDIEEGECSENDSETENSNENIFYHKRLKLSPTKTDISSHSNNSDSRLKLDEIAKAWPPCIRMIVTETSLKKLNVGSLFIITCKGGSLGREGNHLVTIPDVNVSKHHAFISFNEEKDYYTIVDLGSRNGTYIDDKRLSVALQESPPYRISHGNVIRVGTTNLLCHIHDGQETCQSCEPGCMLPSKNEIGIKELKPVKREAELRRLRRKYGLEGPGSSVSSASNSTEYVDRAEVRRKTVGSSNDSEKTETASVFDSIKKENKGFKMMVKMGWSEGDALGKDACSENAIKEPILVEQRPEKVGLGGNLDASHIPSNGSSGKRKATIWKKTVKRFDDSPLE